jgi:glycosyltransferase involved in cell wall biosynthesis
MEFLAKSFGEQTDKDYELIVVDGYPGRPQRGNACEYLLDHKVRVGWYSEPKSKRYNTHTGFANAMNTGVIQAKGKWCVFLHDYCFIPDDAVARWKVSIEDNGLRSLICGFARRYDPVHLPNQWEDDISIWQGAEQDASVPIYIVEDWVPKLWEVFYSAIPTEFLEHINGWDERADDHTTWPLCSILVQAILNDIRLEVDRNLVCHMIDHRDWHKHYPNHVWNYAQLDEPKEPGWYRISPNPYSMRDERKKVHG